MALDALKLVRRMWPHRSARGLRARPEWALLGYHGRVLVSTRVQELKTPLWGPGADKSRFCGPGDRLPGRPRRWRVLLHDGICPSAVSIAPSGVPARKKTSFIEFEISNSTISTVFRQPLTSAARGRFCTTPFAVVCDGRRRAIIIYH